MNFSLEFGLSPQLGLDSWEPIADPAGELVPLENAVKANPDSPERWLRIARLRALLGDHKGASQAGATARKLLRQRLAEKSDSVETMLALAEALPAGEKEEAATLCRAAVVKAPTNWRCQMILGKILDAQSSAILNPGRTNANPGAADETSVQRTRSHALAEEAERAFGEAIRLAPGESEPLLHRGLFHASQAQLTAEDPSARGDRRPQEIVLTAIENKVLPDLKGAEKANPGDYRLLAIRLAVQLTAATSPAANRDGQLTESARGELVEGISKLRRIAEESTAPSSSAGAWESMAVVQYLGLHDTSGADESARRALVVQEGRPRAWNLRAAILLETKRFDDLMTLFEDRLKRTNSLEIHLMAAKIAFNQKRMEGVVPHLEKAGEINPKSGLVLAFRSSYATYQMLDGGEYDVARSATEEAMEGLKTMPPSDERNRIALFVWTNAAVMLAAHNDLAAAREVLVQVRSKFQGDEYVEAIAKIIGE
jgi:tetratricopeptide (TPR) repeat protein